MVCVCVCVCVCVSADALIHDHTMYAGCMHATTSIDDRTDERKRGAVLIIDPHIATSLLRTLYRTLMSMPTRCLCLE